MGEERDCDITGLKKQQQQMIGVHVMKNKAKQNRWIASNYLLINL